MPLGRVLFHNDFFKDLNICTDVPPLLSSANNWIPTPLRSEVTQAAVRRGIRWREMDRSHGATAAGLAMDVVELTRIFFGFESTQVSRRNWRRERKQYSCAGYCLATVLSKP
jgi:hypothetical protein